MRDIALRDYLLGSVLRTASRWLIFGETGVGRSLLAGDLGGAVASGKPVSPRRPCRSRVRRQDRCTTQSATVAAAA
jgi:hypothetical protein